MASYDNSLVEPIEIRMIRPSQFLTRNPDPKNSPELEGLKKSIKDHGLLQPIIVRPLERGFEIVAGHRRFAACKSLHWRHILCKIVEFTDKQAYEIQLTENLQRKTLDPIEEAMSYQKYVVDFGWGGISELAKHIGKSEEYVSHRMQLLKLPETVRNNVEQHVLGVSQALELTDASLSARTQELAQEIIDNKMTIKQIRQLKNEMKQAADGFDYSGMAPEDASDEQAASAQRRHASAAAKKEAVIIKRSVLALRIALSRVDELIDDASKIGPQDKVELIQFLMNVRMQTHTMIDDTLKYKREHCHSDGK